MTRQTNVWFNEANGHQYEEGQRGNLLNGRPAPDRPEWVRGLPDYVFGPITEWSGGECPVPPDAEVRCLFRDRRPYIGPAIYPGFPEPARAAMWQHSPYPGRSNPGSDIIAFHARLA